MSITSNKLKSPIYAERVYNKILITNNFTIPVGWANATNWTITIPSTGRFKIIASGNMLASESSTASNIVCYCRLAKGGVAIVGTSRSVGISINAATYAYNQSPFEILWEDYFIAGEVITLQAAYLAGAGNECRIEYSAGSIEPFMSYELVQQTVSVRNQSEDYATTETDTGKNWIDGKRIYRKCFSGTSTAASIQYVASGVVPDNVIKLEYIQKTAINNVLFPGSEFTTGGLDQVWATWLTATHGTNPNSIYLYHNEANAQSQPYFIIMEYTK